MMESPSLIIRWIRLEPDEILNGLVALVDLGLVAELLDNIVVGVDLHSLLRDHIAGHGRVTEGLSLHDTLHVGGPSELGGDEDAGGLIDTGRDDDLFDLISEDILHELAEGLETGLLLFTLLLLILRLFELEP